MTSTVEASRAEPAAEPDAGYDTAPDGELDIAQYVTFQMEGERYAVPMDQVQEIIRMPALVRVPLGPPSLQGVANLRGRILPVISTRSCCGLPELPRTDATRVIVVSVAGTAGLMVDQVSSVLSVDPAAVEPSNGTTSLLGSDLLAGLIKTPAGVVTSVEVERVIRTQFPRLGQVDVTGEPYRASAQETAAGRDEDDDEGTVELVTFVVDGQEYALPIGQVREILAAPDRINRIPDAPERVLGMVDLRGRLLPVLSLRRIFRLPERELDGQSRVLVVSLDAHRVVGLVTDEVREVLRVDEELLSDLPDGAGIGARDVSAMCRLDGGARLVSVLALDRMFGGNSWPADLDLVVSGEDAAAWADNDEEDDMDDDRRDEDQLVVFRLDGGQYAVDVDQVQEIIRVPATLIRVPNTPSDVEGVVSLRGGVLPVVDLRSRLGLPRTDREERQRIVVLAAGDARTGFIVDSVLEVARIPRQHLEPAPDLSSEQSAVISTMANLPAEDRMLLIVQAGELLARTPAVPEAEGTPDEPEPADPAPEGTPVRRSGTARGRSAGSSRAGRSRAKAAPDAGSGEPTLTPA